MNIEGSLYSQSPRIKPFHQFTIPAPPDMDFLAAACARDGLGPPDGLPAEAPGTVNLLTEKKLDIYRDAVFWGLRRRK